MESFETLTTIVTIVSVIFGILNIILFFKLWGMTDDVKRMLNIMEKSYYGEKEERYNIDEEANKKVSILPTIVILAIVAVVVLLFLINSF